MFLGTAALFFFVLLLGGGGSPAPVMQGALEAVSFLWLLFLLWKYLLNRIAPPGAVWPAAFLLAVFLLPFLHLLPLPYTLWSQLPGRESSVRAVELAGLGRPWMPFSLVPEDTRLAALQLIPTAAIFFGMFALPPGQRLLLSRVPIAVAVITACVGAMQFAFPETRSLYLFPRSIFTQASGLFANRNFQSDFLLIAILLCAVQVRIGRGGTTARLDAPSQLGAIPLICLVLTPFLALMVLATLSRSGALLLAPVLLAALWIASPLKSWKWALAAAGIAGACALLLVVIRPPFVVELMSRFGEGGSRLDPLDDLLYATNIYFPLGSGLGTFDPVYRTVESLQSVKPSYLNHVHDDYLEIAIEAGVIGLALVAVFIIAYLRTAWTLLASRVRNGYSWLQRAGLVAIGLLLVHSIADYPLRTITLQCLLAYFCVVTFSRDPVGDPAGGRR
jgi:O-antigen ligase